MANILILFNASDYAAEPWLAAGHNVLSVDIANESSGLPRWIETTGNHFKVNWDIYVTRRKLHNTPWRMPDFVLAFPPCTDLAVCGNRSAAGKLAADPNYLNKAVMMARYATVWGAPYLIENPVSRLATMWRKPDGGYFDPSDFGGYLPEDDVHPEYPEYIAPRDAYPKKTGYWVGNGAKLPEKRPVSRPTGFSTQYRMLGGRSAKTKRIRSLTPRGAAIAIYEANKELLT